MKDRHTSVCPHERTHARTNACTYAHAPACGAAPPPSCRTVGGTCPPGSLPRPAHRRAGPAVAHAFVRGGCSGRVSRCVRSCTMPAAQPESKDARGGTDLERLAVRPGHFFDRQAELVQLRRAPVPLLPVHAEERAGLRRRPWLGAMAADQAAEEGAGPLRLMQQHKDGSGAGGGGEGGAHWPTGVGGEEGGEG